MECISFKNTTMNMFNTILFFWKSYTASALVAWGLSFFLPIAPFLILSFSLVVIDTITGVIAAKHRGEKIVSSKLRGTVQKILLYCLAILAAEGVRVVLMPSIPVTHLAASAIGLTEFKSIIENVDEATDAGIGKALQSLFSKDKIK